jgi:uncharacterized protein (DUF983 family)
VDQTIRRGIVVLKDDLKRGAAMPRLVCQHCGADLSRFGSVTYSESYPGYLAADREGSIVVGDALLIESTAACSRCGTDIRFHHADVTSGGFGGGRSAGGLLATPTAS